MRSMQMFRALVVLSVVLGLITAQVPWKYCPGAGSAKVSVQSTPINPWPIIKGKTVAFEVVGTANTNISQKNARMDIYTAGTQIFSAAVGNPYIVSGGSGYDYKFTYIIPSFVPP